MAKANKPRFVTLTVVRSGTDMHTLTEYIPGEPMPRDLGGALFLNPHKIEFYRAVAKEISTRADRGERIVYRDLPDP